MEHTLQKKFEDILNISQKYILDFLKENESDPSFLDLSNEGSLLNIHLRDEGLKENEVDNFIHSIFQGAKIGVNTTSPYFMAFIPGGGVPSSAIGGLISQVINRYVGCPFMAPELVRSEMEVIKWLCHLVGYGQESRGILTSGGSMANFSAVVMARDQFQENFDLKDGTAYFSGQTHYGIPKALHMAGILRENFREIKSLPNGEIDCQDLENLIKSDRKRGKRPFFINGNAGTTNTGALDDLNRLGEISSNFRSWFHVDGAYGGLFLLSKRLEGVFRGISNADSVTLDPHKGLFLPYGTGALCVRDGQNMRKSFSMKTAYIPQSEEADKLWDFSHMGPELSREFRGIKVWFPLKLLGISYFRDHLEEKIRLTHYMEEKLRQFKGIKIKTPSQLGIFTFCCLDLKNEKISNHLTTELLQLIQKRGKIYLSGTEIEGINLIRVCINSFRTEQSHCELALQEIKECFRVMTSK